MERAKWHEEMQRRMQMLSAIEALPCWFFFVLSWLYLMIKTWETNVADGGVLSQAPAGTTCMACRKAKTKCELALTKGLRGLTAPQKYTIKLSSQ